MIEFHWTKLMGILWTMLESHTALLGKIACGKVRLILAWKIKFWQFGLLHHRYSLFCACGTLNLPSSRYWPKGSQSWIQVIEIQIVLWMVILASWWRDSNTRAGSMRQEPQTKPGGMTCYDLGSYEKTWKSVNKIWVWWKRILAEGLKTSNKTIARVHVV